MREILFRGQTRKKGQKVWMDGTPVDGEWVYGGVLQGVGDFSIIYGSKNQNDPGEDLQKWCVYTDTLGQYTGLTDKNGKKIFEGDVIKFTDSPFGYSYIGVVCFNEGSFCIKYEYWKKKKFHRIGQTDKWQDMGASGIVTYQYEILGNIHDNPELLENP